MKKNTFFQSNSQKYNNKIQFKKKINNKLKNQDSNV